MPDPQQWWKGSMAQAGGIQQVRKKVMPQMFADGFMGGIPAQGGLPEGTLFNGPAGNVYRAGAQTAGGQAAAAAEDSDSKITYQGEDGKDYLDDESQLGPEPALMQAPAQAQSQPPMGGGPAMMSHPASSPQRQGNTPGPSSPGDYDRYEKLVREMKFSDDGQHFRDQLRQDAINAQGEATGKAPIQTAPQHKEPFWKQLLYGGDSRLQPKQPWSPIDTYKDIGGAAGKAGSALAHGTSLLADGGYLDDDKDVMPRDPRERALFDDLVYRDTRANSTVQPEQLIANGGASQGGDYLGDEMPDGDPSPASVPGMVGVTEDQLKARAPSAPAPMDDPGPDQRVTPPGPFSRVDAANSSLINLLNKYPQRPEPKWWQRGLGAVAGGLAGYSNAAGRTKNPIDINEMRGDILSPGYAHKVEDWKSRVIPAQEVAQIEAGRVTAQQKAAESQATIGKEAAQADYYKGAGRTALVKVSKELADASEGRYKVDQMIPAGVAAAIENNLAGRYDKKDKPRTTQVITDPDQAKRMGVKVGDSVDLSSFNAILSHPEKAEPNANEWQLYLDANKGDAQKALESYRTDKIAIARQSRPAPTTVNFSGTPASGGQAASANPLIQAISNYEAVLPPPRLGNASSMATYEAAVKAIKDVNPKWDQKNYQVVQNALKDFGSGKTSLAVDALNTVSGHLLTLDEAATALKNNDISALNRIGNAVGLQFGSGTGSAVARYNTIVHRIGPELGKAYGTATEGENKLNQSDFDASRGPDLIHGAISASAGLLNGKIASLRHRWETNVKRYNPNREFDAVSPEAQEAFSRLSGGGGQSGGMETQSHNGHTYQRRSGSNDPWTLAK